ncbi:MAG TPA: TlpA disulfide reductase family protein [Pyrinomonadaceae bacterium]|nr:TlpA disulfide reductase family protein [Pyrinomonadaceae bacterium]
MMKKKLALALMLALSGAGAFDSTARPRAAHALANDGSSRRGGSGAQRKARPSRPRGKGVTAGKRNGAPEASALAPVTELDADALKRLLQRGDAEAARPLLLNFWATWCVPCRKEFPDLVKIEAEYRGRGLEFALVSADDVSDIKTAVPGFLREMRATAMPAYLLNAADTEAAIAQVDPAWGGELPATFIFDRQGKLAYKHFGIIKVAELREAIEKVVTGDK